MGVGGDCLINPFQHFALLPLHPNPHSLSPVPCLFFVCFVYFVCFVFSLHSTTIKSVITSNTQKSNSTPISLKPTVLAARRGNSNKNLLLTWLNKSRNLFMRCEPDPGP